jgi:hypothetical protein
MLGGMRKYPPLAFVIGLDFAAILAAGLFVDLVGVQRFPWSLLMFGAAAALLGYALARLFRMSRVDLGMMVAVGVIACVLALPAAIYYAAAALVG